MVKLIILDLDGTLLHSDKSVSALTLSVLAQCQMNGIRIAIATARSETAAARYIKLVKPDAVISDGGALVRCDRRTIYECCISADTADRLIVQLQALPGYVEMSVETSEAYFVSWTGSASSDYSHSVYHDFGHPLHMDAYKITVHLEHTEGLRQLAVQYPDCGLLSFSDGPWYRFANKHATKMQAIMNLAREWGLSLSEIVAFGDDYNDEEMLHMCGIGVAMENAVETVKNAADCVCDSNDGDGVARWLMEHVLTE